MTRPACRTILVLLFFLGATSAGARAQDCQASCAGLPGIGPVSPSPRSFTNFIIRAYQGAYGRTPTCTEQRAEYFRLLNAEDQGVLHEEASRFIATLFETQASYDVKDLITYRQTDEYQRLNPQESHDRVSLERFITDLYETYLQRAPDAAGHCFWTNDICSLGRKKGLVAFEVSIEFGDLVDRLFDGGIPCFTRPPCLLRNCEGSLNQ